MRLQTFGVLAAVAQVSYAFPDTSPFFLFSTSEVLIPSEFSVQLASSLTTSLKSSLGQCPTQFYILVSQDGVTSSDFASQRTAPSLSKWMSGKDKSIRSSSSISDVIGSVDPADLGRSLNSQCGAKEMDIDMTTGSFPVLKNATPTVLRIKFEAPVASNKIESLQANDAFLSSFVESLPSQNYTVIYLSTPSAVATQDRKSYEMDSSSMQEPLHMDLKRDLGDAQAMAKNYTILTDGPLFERYQYFTPGIFMGFLVGFPLLALLYVAINGVASLEISYAAFDKESGPQSQGPKKQD